MPMYVYRRQDGSTIEIRQAVWDDELTVCPETGQPMSRVLQPFGSPRLGPRFHDEAKRGERPDRIA